MTISAQPTRKTYNCVGTAGPYIFPYRFLTDADLVVTRIDADGVSAVLDLESGDYTVSGAGDNGGGSVLTATEFADGQISIWLDVEITQETAYTPGDAFPAASHEAALDKLTLIAAQTRGDLEAEIAELTAQVDALAEEVAAGGGGGGGGSGSGTGLVRYAYNPATPTLSLSHKDTFAVGEYVPVGAFDSRRQQGSQALYEVLNATPSGPVAGPTFNIALCTPSNPAYDPTNPRYRRLFMEGSALVYALVDDDNFNLAKIGLLSNNTSATLGQEAIFATARDYVQSKMSDDIQSVIFPGILFNGCVWTDVGMIDMGMAPWIAGSRGKLFAKNGIKDGSGNNLPYPIIKFGRGIWPQNRFTIDSTHDVYVEGDQNSNLDNALTRVIGIEYYDETGAGGYHKDSAHRCYIGTRIRGNSEKCEYDEAHFYCSIAVDYAQLRVKVSHYRTQAIAAGLTPVPNIEYLIMLEDRGTAGKQAADPWPSGYKGEWNAVLNQQGLATGSAVGKDGAHYKIATGGTLSPAIDGITNVTAGKWFLAAGGRWWQVDDTDDTPDTNIVRIKGNNNEVGFATSYNGDLSATVYVDHESRIYKGGTIQLYRDLVESRIVPTAFLQDYTGKIITWVLRRARAGDQLLFGVTAKTKGADTSVFDGDENHIKGQVWLYDDGTRCEGKLFAEDTQNGVAPGRPNVPTCVFEWVRWVDGADMHLKVAKALNSGTGDDGEPVAAVIIGDHFRKKGCRDAELGSVSVEMGNAAPGVPDPAAGTLWAIDIRYCNGLSFPSPRLRGKVRYRKGAKRVAHKVPAAWIKARDPVQLDAGASVTQIIDGELTAREAFTCPHDAAIRMIAPSVDGIGFTRIGGKWRPESTPKLVAVDVGCVDSDANRYYDVGTIAFLTDLDVQVELLSDGTWRDETGAIYTPDIMTECQDILDRWTALGVALPTGADLAKLDRAVYRYVKGGLWTTLRTWRNVRWNSTATDAIKWAGTNLAALNCSDPTGHPYDVTLPAPNWTRGRGLNQGGTARTATGLNPSAAISGAWHPQEGLVVGGVFQATIQTACFDHGLVSGHPSNGFEITSDNGCAGLRARSQSGACSRMNSQASADFSINASTDPHAMTTVRSGTTAADHANYDGPELDSIATDTANYAADYAAGIGVPDAFYLLGGKTNGGLLAYCDRTVGWEIVATPWTADQVALADDIEKEMGTSDGFYT